MNAIVPPDFQATTKFLTELIAIPSVSGQEAAAMDYLRRAFGRFDVEIEAIPLSNALRADPEYSSPVPDLTYDNRCNLRIVRRGLNPHRTLLFNAHVDVVPPSEGMTSPWTARIADGVLYGRGACDNKGPLSTLYRLLELCEIRRTDPDPTLIFHFVVEEENGGNGTLAMARRGEQADGCIVLEPTEGRVLTSIRGAVWFRIVFQGVAGHSGQAGQTRSALLMAHQTITHLTAYQQDLLRQSRGIALFDAHENPMPITFGRLAAGNWPASAPNRAVLEGVLGFLPNRTKEQVAQELAQILTRQVGLRPEDFELGFTYRHDCSVTDPADWLPRTLCAAAARRGQALEVAAMTASCDAWFYNNLLGIPTVVFGPGSLAVAHAKEERIALNAITDAAEILYEMVGGLGETR